MITRRLAYVGCALASAGLAAGFFLRGFYAGSAFVIVLGFFWLLAIRRRWGWVSPTMLLMFGLFNAILILIQSPPYIEVISLSATLIAWDLDHFVSRLERIRSGEMASGVEKAHLQRLFASIGAGILIAAAAMLIHIQLSFAVAMICGAIALIALNQVVNRLAPRHNKPTRPNRPL